MFRRGLILTICLISQLYAEIAMDRNQIEARIKPVGRVHLEVGVNEVAANSHESTITTAVSPDSGQAVFDKYCRVCHQDGLAGAPKFRNEKDWSRRMDIKTLDELVASATKGLNAMPARGTCATCTDEAIKQAIEYMLPK